MRARENILEYASREPIDAMLRGESEEIDKFVLALVVALA